MNVIESIKEKAGSVVESSLGLRKTGVDVLEKSSKAALESYRFYNDLSLEQLRAMASIHDLASLRSYLGQSIVISGEIFKHAVEDIQKNFALTAEFRASVTEALSGAIKPASTDAGSKTASAKHKTQIAA